MTAWLFCTSGAAAVKAGKNANSTITASGSVMLDFYYEAESFVCATAKVNLVTLWNTLNSSGKYIIQDIVTSHIAQKVINYDMGGFTSRTEAVTMLNILENNIKRGAALLEDDKYRTYLGAT